MPLDGDGGLRRCRGICAKVLAEEMLELTVHQKEALNSILSSKDTLVYLPTEHGKYIIFECLPHCHDCLCGDLWPEQGHPLSV